MPEILFSYLFMPRRSMWDWRWVLLQNSLPKRKHFLSHVLNCTRVNDLLCFQSHNNTGSTWTAPIRQTSCKQFCWQLWRSKQHPSHQATPAWNTKGAKGKEDTPNYKWVHGQEAHIELATICTQTAKSKEISRPRCNHKRNAHPPRQQINLQTHGDLQPHLGNRHTPANMEGSNNDPNPLEREIPQPGSQLPPHKPHQLCWEKLWRELSTNASSGIWRPTIFWHQNKLAFDSSMRLKIWPHTWHRK